MPRYGKAKGRSPVRRKGFNYDKETITMEELGSYFEELATKAIDSAQSGMVAAFKNATQNTYNKFKKPLEFVVLKHETDDNKSTVIPTELKIYDIQERGVKGAIIIISADDGIKNAIVKAQLIGTGYKVHPGILNYFNVQEDTMKTEDGEETDMSNWYFDITGIDKAFVNEFSRIYGTLVEKK